MLTLPHIFSFTIAIEYQEFCQLPNQRTDWVSWLLPEYLKWSSFYLLHVHHGHKIKIIWFVWREIRLLPIRSTWMKVKQYKFKPDFTARPWSIWNKLLFNTESCTVHWSLWLHAKNYISSPYYIAVVYEQQSFSHFFINHPTHWLLSIISIQSHPFHFDSEFRILLLFSISSPSVLFPLFYYSVLALPVYTCHNETRF